MNSECPNNNYSGYGAPTLYSELEDRLYTATEDMLDNGNLEIFHVSRSLFISSYACFNSFFHNEYGEFRKLCQNLTKEQTILIMARFYFFGYLFNINEAAYNSELKYWVSDRDVCLVYSRIFGGNPNAIEALVKGLSIVSEEERTRILLRDVFKIAFGPSGYSILRNSSAYSWALKRPSDSYRVGLDCLLERINKIKSDEAAQQEINPGEEID